MSVASTLTNLKVRTRILSGFVCALTILLIVGATLTFALRHVGDLDDIVEQRSKVIRTVNDIELQFANARRLAREYAHTGIPGEAASAEAGMAKTEETIKLSYKVIANPEPLARVHEIEEAGLQ